VFLQELKGRLQIDHAFEAPPGDHVGIPFGEAGLVRAMEPPQKVPSIVDPWVGSHLPEGGEGVWYQVFANAHSARGTRMANRPFPRRGMLGQIGQVEQSTDPTYAPGQLGRPVSDVFQFSVLSQLRFQPSLKVEKDLAGLWIKAQNLGCRSTPGPRAARNAQNPQNRHFVRRASGARNGRSLHIAATKRAARH
jgi:hypothetical protein